MASATDDRKSVTIDCPGCGAAMSAIPLQDRSGIDFEVDVCRSCRAFWFDRYENTRLSSGSTLRLFNLMAEESPASPAIRDPLKCPRCAKPLKLTHDMQQRATHFEYWRCVKHGHFITFLQFLKEKDFVRPLTPKQIAELRQNLQTVNCSNCGGPIDLVKQSKCPHCGSPLTMIDMKQIAAHVHELEQADTASRNGERASQSNMVTWTLRIGDRTEVIRSSSHDRPDVERMFAEAVSAMNAESGSKSLVQAGLGVVIRWLKKD